MEIQSPKSKVRRSPSVIHFAVCGLLVLLFANAGLAFLVQRSSRKPYPGLKWNPSSFPVTVHLQSGYPTNADLRTVSAMHEWNSELRSLLKFNEVLGSDVPSTPPTQDASSNITWRDAGSAMPLMTTYLWYSAGTGQINEFDIDVNTNSGITWSYDVTTPPSGTYDYWNCLTHELGYALGLRNLSHVRDPLPPYDPYDEDKTMFSSIAPQEIKKRTIEQDDKDGMEYQYPDVNPPDCYPSTCAVDRVWVCDCAPAADGTGGDDGHVPWILPNANFGSPDINPAVAVYHKKTPVPVTVRNPTATRQYATVTLEVHVVTSNVLLPGDYERFDSRTMKRWIEPGNRAKAYPPFSVIYTNPKGDGETDVPLWWRPGQNVLGQGHFCYVAIVSAGPDDPPFIGDPNDPNLPYNYSRYMYNNNNICCHNVYQVPVTGPFDSPAVAIFSIGNPFDSSVRQFMFDTVVGKDTGWHISFGGVPNGESLGPNQPRTCTCSVSLPSGILPGGYARFYVTSLTVKASNGETLGYGGLCIEARYSPPSNVGMKTLLAPTGGLAYGIAVTPACSVENHGTNPEYFWVRMSIGTDYDDQTYVESLPPGATRYVAFKEWIASPAGAIAVQCSTELEHDLNQGDDYATGSVTVGTAPPAWLQRADLPGGPKNKKVKDGGCLTAYEDTTECIYALKGNNRLEFYAYDIARNAWTTKESIPAIGSMGKKKAVKKGACITNVDGVIYAAKGGGTVEFYRFSPGASFYPWEILPDVPLGAKSVKEGAGAVGVTVNDTPCVYFLKGSGTQEFYRYNTFANVWLTRASPPLGTSGKTYKIGSCLAASADGSTIYVLKGSYNEFAAYDVASDVWSGKANLPLVGSSTKKKKAKAGAGLACFGDYAYALKGNNTREFWVYDPTTDAWTQTEDMPVGGGKNIKGGGALTAAADKLFAFKGNNTLEFYSYTPPVDELDGTASPSNTLSHSTLDPRHSTLAVAPNPFTGSTTVCLSLPRPGNINLKLYDVSGRIARTLATGYRKAGTSSFTLQPSSLSRGIYLLRLETDDATLTRKLIIE